jgi:DUF1680 family protein
MLLVISLTSGQAGERFDDIARDKYRYATLRPVRLFDAEITGGYLQTYIATSMEKGVPDYLEKFERHGCIENFRIVGKQEKKKHVGGPNNNEFVHKLVEAAGYYAARSPDIKSSFARIIGEILSAQADNGYLNTYYDNPIIREKSPGNRFRPGNRFEFYNFGHFTQAAIAWYRTTGDRKMFDAAIKFGDLICDEFSAPNLLPYTRNRHNRPNLKYEHPNHELAMVELYRVTGNKRYLEFARHTLDQYDFWNFNEVWGHAVQETLLLAGGTDVYLEYGRPEMLIQLEKMWHDVVDRKMYLTGGVGCKQPGEAYGDAYELPNATSYCETCAAISKVFWDYRMVLATGDAKYADDMERTLYNAVLAGVSLDGRHYFYVNRMETKEPIERKGWFNCSCCPPNVHRLLGSLQQYLYTVDDSGVQIHLYNTSAIETKSGQGQAISLSVRTDYPRGGNVEIAIGTEGRYAISLRIPLWAHEAKLVHNNESIDNITAGVYRKIERDWKKGDILRLNLSIKPRLVRGNPEVKDQQNKIAIMRGPLLYCLEQIDNTTDIFGLSVARDVALSEEESPLLNGIVRLKGKAFDSRGREIDFTAVPYNVWNNRKPTPMRIWIPVAERKRRVASQLS